MPWRKVLLAAAVFLCTLELVLQIGALLVARSLPAPEPGGGPAVLCLGDSYTAGIGASSPERSYPRQLEQRLHDLGHTRVHVVNGGCPGQDSAFLLRRLPKLLRPGTEVVCVMMAFNDSWARPARVDPSELEAEVGDSTFQWRWRTGRLLALCLGFGENSWHRTSEQIAATDGGPATSLLDREAGFALLGDLGLFDPASPLPAYSLPAGPLAQAIPAVERSIAAGDGPAALRLAEDLARDHPDSPFALKELAIAAHLAGDAARADAALAALDRAVAAMPADAAANESRIIAAMGAGHAAAAIDAARAYLAHEPRSLAAWMVLQDATFQLGRIDEFRTAAPSVLRLSGRLFPPQSANIARHFAEVTKAEDPARAAKLLVAAALLDGDRGLTRAKVAALRDAVPFAAFAAAVAAAQPTDAGMRAALLAALRTAYDDDGSAATWVATLRDHLTRIAELCARRGAKLVVLEYPFPHPRLEVVQREIAQRFGAVFVPVRERFDAELRTRPRADLFVANGHCTDAGYAIVAELAAGAVAPLLRN